MYQLHVINEMSSSLFAGSVRVGPVGKHIGNSVFIFFRIDIQFSVSGHILQIQFHKVGCTTAVSKVCVSVRVTAFSLFACDCGFQFSS